MNKGYGIRVEGFWMKVSGLGMMDEGLGIRAGPREARRWSRPRPRRGPIPATQEGFSITACLSFSVTDCLSAPDLAQVT